MRFRQRLGNLADDTHGLDRLQRAMSKNGRERFPLDQLHSDEEFVRLLFDRIDRGDVRMIHLGDRPRLAQESRLPLRIVRDALGENLDRHLAHEPRVFGSPHLSHAASAEAVDQAVVA